MHLAPRNSSLFRFLLIECQADPLIKSNGITVMHKAAFFNNSYVLTYLRDKVHMSIDERDDQDNTPLHYACDQKSSWTIFWLIHFGVDVNA